jgi:multiple sugar transport system permease protein
VVLVLSVVWHWNNHYEPGIYLRRPHLGFLPGRIRNIIAIVNAPPEEMFEMLGMIADGEDTLTNAVIMAGTALVIAPVLLFFTFAQRLFMQGIERAGITGE